MAEQCYKNEENAETSVNLGIGVEETRKMEFCIHRRIATRKAGRRIRIYRRGSAYAEVKPKRIVGLQTGRRA
jgi:hypothetical protein